MATNQYNFLQFIWFSSQTLILLTFVEKKEVLCVFKCTTIHFQHPLPQVVLPMS